MSNQIRFTVNQNFLTIVGVELMQSDPKLPATPMFKIAGGFYKAISQKAGPGMGKEYTAVLTAYKPCRPLGIDEAKLLIGQRFEGRIERVPLAEKDWSQQVDVNSGEKFIRRHKCVLIEG